MDWICTGPVDRLVCEPFAFGFMQRALLAGMMAVITTSVVGSWVVMRGLSFMGDALAHGVVPGIALAVLVGFDPGLGAVLAALVMVAGIDFVHRRTPAREDTGIGLLFVGMLALGVVILSRSESYATSLTAILFGDALGVGGSDLWLSAATLGVALVASLVLYRPFLVLSFNEGKAELLGLRPGLAHFAMLALVTLALVGSFRTVGTLLAVGLLIAPPATASLLARRVPTMMATAVAVGIGAVVSGLLISFHADTAAGATMAGMAVALFFVVLVGRDFWAQARRRQMGRSPGTAAGR